MGEDSWFSGCIWGCSSVPVIIVMMVVQSLFQNSKRGPLWSLKSHQKVLRAERKGESLDDFKAAFASEDIAEIAICCVYQVLSVSAFGRPLPPHRDDSLINVFGWGSMMDPDMVLKAIAEKCWITLGEMNDAGDTPRTVERLVFLTSRAIEERNRQDAAGSLLRPIEGVSASSELLRPAQAGGSEHDETLLRSINAPDETCG